MNRYCKWCTDCEVLSKFVQDSWIVTSASILSCRRRSGSGRCSQRRKREAASTDPELSVVWADLIGCRQIWARNNRSSPADPITSAVCNHSLDAFSLSCSCAGSWQPWHLDCFAFKQILQHRQRSSISPQNQWELSWMYSSMLYCQHQQRSSAESGAVMKFLAERKGLFQTESLPHFHPRRKLSVVPASLKAVWAISKKELENTEARSRAAQEWRRLGFFSLISSADREMMYANYSSLTSLEAVA